MDSKQTQPDFPIVAICANDWSIYQEQEDLREDFDLIPVWIVGMLIKEDKNKIVISHQHFLGSKETRFTSVISKSSIMNRIDYPTKKTKSNK